MLTTELCTRAYWIGVNSIQRYPDGWIPGVRAYALLGFSSFSFPECVLQIFSLAYNMVQNVNRWWQKCGREFKTQNKNVHLCVCLGGWKKKKHVCVCVCKSVSRAKFKHKKKNYTDPFISIIHGAEGSMRRREITDSVNSKR